MRMIFPSLLLSLFLLTSCSSNSSSSTGVDLFAFGQYFSDDVTLGVSGNGYSCITCHEPPETSRKRAGQAYSSYTLSSLYGRRGYWNNQVPDLRSAINRCITTYMHGEQLSPQNPAWQGLEVYLHNIASRSSDSARTISNELYLLPGNRAIDTVRYENVYRNGVAFEGQTAYFRYCNYCHANGINGAIDLRYRSDYSIAQLAYHTRLSSSSVVPGRMPFFLETMLPTDSLRNIIAYLRISK